MNTFFKETYIEQLHINDVDKIEVFLEIFPQSKVILKGVRIGNYIELLGYCCGDKTP